MKKFCSKCGKELKNGNICISMKNKTDLCSECGMIEALEFHNVCDAEKVVEEVKNVDKK